MTPLSLSLFLCHFLSLSVFHPLTLSHMSLIPQLFHSNTLTHTHTHPYTHTRTKALSLFLSHEQTDTQGLAHFLSLSLHICGSLSHFLDLWPDLTDV